MNKYILSSFVLLLAVQGYNAQFLGAIFMVFMSIFGFIFNVILAPLPVILISFTEVFSVVISSVVFTTLATLNGNIFNAVAKLNATAGNASAISNIYVSMISRQSSVTIFLGKVASGNVKDVLTEISYTSAALASISAGCSPPQSQPFSLSDTPYPDIYSCFNASSNATCTNTTISCQASAYVALSAIQIQNIQAADDYLQALLSLCSDNSSMPNITSAQTLIGLWGNLSVSAQNYTTVNATGQLLVYAGGNFSTNVSTALNMTAQYLDEFVNATSALFACTTKPVRISKSSKVRKNIQNWGKLLTRRGRRWARNRAHIAVNSFYYSVSQSFALLINSANQFLQYINGINTASFVYNNARQHGIIFNALTGKFNVSFSAFAQLIKSYISAVEQTKVIIVENATDVINATFAPLYANMSADNSSCRNLTNDLIQAVATGWLGILDCGAVADNLTQAAVQNASETYRVAIQNISATMNSSNDCYKNGCAAAAFYPFSSYGVQCVNDNSMVAICWKWAGLLYTSYYCPSSYANAINSCLSSIIASMNATISAVDAIIANVTSALNANLGAILTNYTTCVANQVNLTLTAMNAVGANYTACVNSTSNATTTTTPAPSAG